MMKLIVGIMLAALMQFPPVVSSEQKATIEGVVSNTAGNPIAGAEVSAFWDPPPTIVQASDVPRAITGPDGRFVISASPGSYRISARADGYVRQTFGSSPLLLKSGDTARDVNIRLSSDSILSGRVTSTDGQPLLRMQVMVLQRRFTAAGVAQTDVARLVETNDRGEYRIDALGPGAYYVAAGPISSGRLMSEQFRVNAGRLAPQPAPTPGSYAAVIHPNATRLADAIPVVVRTGTEITNIDFVLPRIRSYAIRGRVVDGATGVTPTQRPNMSVLPARYEYLAGTSSTGESYRSDGSFVLSDLAPGRYWVQAQISPSLTPEQRQVLATPGASTAELPLPVRGIALIDIVDADVDNVELTLVHNLEVSGHLSVEGVGADVAAIRNDIKIQLRPVDELGNGGPVAMSLEEDGSFVYRRMMPTEHRLTVTDLPAGLYVKEARMGNTDALSHSLLLTRQPQESLQIALARGAVINGTAIDASGMPVASQRVVLVPEAGPNRPDLYRTAMTNASGRFVLEGVAPGEFAVYAWQRLEEFQYFDPEFVSAFQDRGSVVHVAEPAEIITKVQVIVN